MTGQISFPLRKGVPRDQIAYDIAADLRDMRVAGPVSLDGIAADATWDKRFGAANAGKSQMRATVTLSLRFLDAFNIALPDGTITGSG